MSRKADRERMANLLIDAVTRAGARAEITPQTSDEIWVAIKAPGGAEINTEFRGWQEDVYVETWNLRGHRFFNPIIHDVNPHHYHKATRVCYSFDELVKALTYDVERFVDGSGYLKLDDPRIVAMGERYKMFGWTWPFEGGT